MEIYTFSRNKFINSEVFEIDYYNESAPEIPLLEEIEAMLPDKVDKIKCIGDELLIYCYEALSAEEEQTLSSIVANHE